MDVLIPAAPISPLRQRLIDDMNMRRFSRETQRNYIRDIGRFAWVPSRKSAVAFGLLCIAGLLALSNLSPFIYFQF